MEGEIVGDLWANGIVIQISQLAEDRKYKSYCLQGVNIVDHNCQ